MPRPLSGSDLFVILFPFGPDPRWPGRSSNGRKGARAAAVITGGKVGNTVSSRRSKSRGRTAPWRRLPPFA